MQPLVSIIIPTYNSEKFIFKALDSIKQQCFQAYEVIIVDAGSDDKTKDICALYDERFIFFELKGSKQGEARNLGVSNANGELVMFLDSDDIFSDDHVLTDSIQKVSEIDADFYNFAVSFVKEKVVMKNILFPKEFHADSRDEILSLGLYGKSIHTIPWNKIYKRKFLTDNDIIFPKLKEQEDMVFVIHCCMKANKVIFVNRIIVNAEIRNDSLSRTMSSINIQCCLDVFQSIERLLKSEGILEMFKEEFNCYKMRTSAYTLLMTTFRVRSDDDFWKGVRIIKKSGSLEPWLSISMLKAIKVTTALSIMIAKFSLSLRIFRLFRNLKLIKGY